MVEVLPGYSSMMAGQFEDAEEAFRRLVSQYSANTGWRYFLALILLNLGRRDEAVQEFHEVAKADPANTMARLGTAMAFASQRDCENATLALDSGVLVAARRDFAYAEMVAGCYSLLGDLDCGLEWTERAMDLGFANYPFLHEHDRLLEPLRQDHRFSELMVRAKREWEEFDA